jgi:hypothetical protein
MATALIETAFAALFFTKVSVQPWLDGSSAEKPVRRAKSDQHGCMAAGTKKGSDAALLRLPSRQEGLDCAVQHGDGVAVLLPFLGVSSLNFGPLSRAAFFLG